MNEELPWIFWKISYSQFLFLYGSIHLIDLYQFHPIWGLPNASPFCMKLETYLRMAKLPYKVHYISNPQRAPKGKLPYVQIDEKSYADSELIIDELKSQFGDPLDFGLTEEQRALGHLIEQAFCERLYWIFVYLRWQDEAGWSIVKDVYFRNMPTLLKLFVPALIRKKMLKALYMQGTGRHSKDEIVLLGRKTIDALEKILGTQPYFLGDKPSSIDATAFAFVANLLMSPLKDPLKQYALQQKSINAYCHRMWDSFYPELPKQ